MAPLRCSWPPQKSSPFAFWQDLSSRLCFSENPQYMEYSGLPEKHSRNEISPPNPQKRASLRMSNERTSKASTFFLKRRTGNQNRYTLCLHWFPVFLFLLRTYVIAQTLIFSSELCYTIRGQCFMLSVNYEKCPLIRCFSEEVHQCHLRCHNIKKFRISRFLPSFPPRSKWFPRTIRSWRAKSTSS